MVGAPLTPPRRLFPLQSVLHIPPACLHIGISMGTMAVVKLEIATDIRDGRGREADLARIAELAEGEVEGLETRGQARAFLMELYGTVERAGAGAEDAAWHRAVLQAGLHLLQVLHLPHPVSFPHPVSSTSPASSPSPRAPLDEGLT